MKVIVSPPQEPTFNIEGLTLTQFAMISALINNCTHSNDNLSEIVNPMLTALGESDPKRKVRYAVEITGMNSFMLKKVG